MSISNDPSGMNPKPIDPTHHLSGTCPIENSSKKNSISERVTANALDALNLSSKVTGHSPTHTEGRKEPIKWTTIGNLALRRASPKKMLGEDPLLNIKRVHVEEQLYQETKDVSSSDRAPPLSDEEVKNLAKQMSGKLLKGKPLNDKNKPKILKKRAWWPKNGTLSLAISGRKNEYLKIKSSEKVYFKNADGALEGPAKVTQGWFSSSVTIPAGADIIILAKGEQLVSLDGQEKILKQTDLPIAIAALLQEGSPESINTANELIPQMKAIINQPTPGKKSGGTYDHVPDDFPISHATNALAAHEELVKKGKPALSDKALEHLLQEVLRFEGDKFDWSAPNAEFAGIAVRETENHLLMGGISAHRKNQFLLSNRETANRLGYDNDFLDKLEREDKKLQEKLGGFINTIIEAGPFEFNSKPYAEPTVRALAILADSDSPLKNQGIQALDTIFLLHAKGSLGHHTFAPMRRRVNKDEPASLGNYLSSFAETWASPKSDLSHLKKDKLMFNASTMKYRPTKEIMELMNKKGEPGESSFDRIGHGFKPSSIFDRIINWVSYKTIRSCPEIYSSGKTQEGADYLLSAGGVTRSGPLDGWQSDIFSRLTCLITSDAKQITDTFYLGDPIDEVDLKNDPSIKKLDKKSIKKAKESHRKKINEAKKKEGEAATLRLDDNPETMAASQTRAAKLEEEAKSLRSLAELESKTEVVLQKAQKRNNTGVYKNFACGACPVNPPAGQEPEAVIGDWKLYKADNGLYMAVYGSSRQSKGQKSMERLTGESIESPQLGIMALFDLKESDMDSPEKAQKFLKTVVKANPDSSKLQTTFKFPDEHGGDTLVYDTKASEEEWVMKSVNGIKLNRDYESWPLLTTETKV